MVFVLSVNMVSVLGVLSVAVFIVSITMVSVEVGLYVSSIVVEETDDFDDLESISDMALVVTVSVVDDVDFGRELE